MRDAQWLAAYLMGTRLLGSIASKEQALAIVLAGRERGHGAMTSLRNMHVIQGKVVESAALLAGEVLSSGHAEYFEPDMAKCDATKAVWTTKRKGSPREQTFEFTVAMAEKQGLLSKGGNWNKIRPTMLRWRACSELARACYPDIVSNAYTEADFPGDES